MIRSFLNIDELTETELRSLIEKKNNNPVLKNKSIGLLFEKYSTRTRLSFNVAISQLGGNPVDIRLEELNISRNETFEDTFKAMNCYLDGLVFRTDDHQKLIEASKYFKKPIINALSDVSHPCQIVSDIFTLKDHFKTLNLNILWVGDFNNVSFSLVQAANLIDEMKLTVCTPKQIESKIKCAYNHNTKIVNDLDNIELKNIDCVMTDVFLSMNDNDNKDKIKLLEPYKVTSKLMQKTSKSSIFMHCLPANVGNEVSEEVFTGSKSIVWKQAYNRLVAQKNLLEYLYQNPFNV